MNHLLYPLDTHVAPLQFPIVCDGEAEYDGLPFATYPIRQGWSTTTGSLQWLQCTDDELAKRMQLWLYFGVLSSFCGHVIPRAALRDTDLSTNTIRLSTAQLPCMLNTRKVADSDENLDTARIMLMYASRLSEMIEGRLLSRQKVLLQVSCSIRILLETLNSTQGLQLKTLNPARRYSLGRRWPFEFSTGLIHGLKISAAKAIKYKMAELGWCPTQIANLSYRYSGSTLYFLSGLPLPCNISHAICTASRCIAYNIDESHYVPQHRNNCGRTNCTLTDVSSASVASIIENDFGIPLVSCSFSSHGTMRTEIVRAMPDSKYIAISHVWSGGLGNPSKNGLPECQLKYLMSRVESLRDKMSTSINVKNISSPGTSVFFWIDTFCVPVGDPFRASRRKAINSMAEIYSGAKTILVLDPELQNLSAAKLRAEQVIAHLLCSSWMTRCWTLQEASLSNSWYIDFKDGPVNIVNVTDRLRRKSKIEFLLRQGRLESSMKRAFVEELSSFLVDMGEVRYQRRGRYSRSEIWNLKQLESHQAYVFATTWNNFLGRTTSKLEDLHQILAGLEDIRFTSIQDLQVRDRMKAILKCHASLPIDLLFCSCDRMLEGDSLNAWAPEFPQGQRLDERLGTMKVFTDCLYISKEEALQHLQICVIPLKGFLSTFVLDLPQVGRQWIEMYSTEMSGYAKFEDVAACLIYPVADSPYRDRFPFRSCGARFLLRHREGNDLHLTYDASFCIYAYDRSDQDPQSKTYPLLSIELIETTPRVFIDCSMLSSLVKYPMLLKLIFVLSDLDDWPAAQLLYDTVEGPMFTKPAPYILFPMFILVPLTWTFSLIITMAAAASFNIRRLPVFYCYVGRSTFLVAETFWYINVFEHIEREVWSLNASRDNSDFSSYKAINRYPCLLFGPKRAIITICAAILFLGLGTMKHEESWALWLGILLLWEFVLRSVLYFCWFILPSQPRIRAWLEQAKASMLPKWVDWSTRPTRTLRASHERTPFLENAAEPFRDTWSNTWESYIGIPRRLLSKPEHRVERTDGNASQRL